MIYTSYYGNRNIPEELVKVGISRGRALVSNTLPLLAPDKDLLDFYKSNPKNLDQKQLEEYYTIQYNKMLETLNAKDVERYIKQYYGEQVVLMCYESRGKFCHRHLVRAWLINNEIDCEEL